MQPTKQDSALQHVEQNGAVQPPNLFRRNGDVWEIRFNGSPERPCSVFHMKGIGHIETAMKHQGQRIPLDDLFRKDREASSPRSAVSPSKAGLSRDDGRERPIGVLAGSEEHILDDKGRKALEKNLSEIAEERRKAQKNRDTATCDRLDLEVAEIERQLRVTRKRDGTERSFGDEREKARKAVSNAVSRAYQAMGEFLPCLEKHLRKNVDISADGMMYAPDSSFHWEF